MDSSTVLAIAQSEQQQVFALSFDYGQRHSAELNAAKRIAAAANVAEHRIINIDIGQLGGSALTDESIAVPDEQASEEGDDIPVTYVPARNTVFLSYALAWAEVLDADLIYTGVNAVDYSGYPDCRPEYVDAFQKMANLATKRGVEGNPIEIRSPLINLGKDEIITAGLGLGVDYSQTISCYAATDDGLACGQCDACRLRAEGFRSAGVEDPTRYVA